MGRYFWEDFGSALFIMIFCGLLFAASLFGSPENERKQDFLRECAIHKPLAECDDIFEKTKGAK